MKKRGHSELVVFGRRAVLEALAQPDSDVEVSEVWVVKSTPGTFRSELAAACRKRALELRSGSLAQVNAFSGEPKHDQGVAARIRLGRIAEVESFLEARKGKHARAPMRLLALDGVTNSQNIGM
ncbi:MAG: RNA methyltransferase substrate-binding domain-containing protein, partial [Myxococcota bacterium]